MKSFFSYISILAFSLVASCATGGAKMENAISYPASRSASVVEKQRVIVGLILLPPPSDGVCVKIITPSGKEIEAAWPGWDRAMFVNTRWNGTEIASVSHRRFLVNQAASKIDSSQEYSIELLTRSYIDSKDVYNDILRVSKNGQVMIDASICQVHKLPMKRQLQDVCSADSYPESFFPKQKKEFPNDGNVYLGCGAGRDLTWKCPACSRAYEPWAR